MRFIIPTFSLFLLVPTITINSAYGFSGYYDLFKRSHPLAYATIESYFEPIAQNLGFSRPNDNQILDIVSNKGVGRTPDGAPYLLLGRRGGGIRIFTPNSGNIQLTMNYVEQDITPKIPRLITASAIGKNIKKSAPASSGRQLLSFPLEKGVNWIGFKTDSASEKEMSLNNFEAATIIYDLKITR